MPYSHSALHHHTIEGIFAVKLNHFFLILALAALTSCSSAYYGAMEKLGAADPLVTHDRCGAEPGAGSRPCVFEVSWK